MASVPWNAFQPTSVKYSIAASSEHSGRYSPENIKYDRPTEVQSRWSGAKEIFNQWILLELSNVAVLDSITFGKYHQPHPCNMKEFKVEVGMTQEQMSEVLYETLKNDAKRETFALPRTTRGGVPISTRFVKIIPISTHAHNYNTSIWFVELSGFTDKLFVQNIVENYENNKEVVAMRHILKHLRQRRHLTTYYQLSAQTGIRLEHPLVSELYETLIIKGDWEQAEQSLHALSLAGLFSSFVNTYRPSARWRRLRGVDANGDAPSKRGGHAMCMDVENQQIYLFGGFDGRKSLNDFWIYDIRSDRWRVLSHDVSKEHGPGPRACHKMAFDPKSGYIYLLGRLADEDMPKMTFPSNEQTGEALEQNGNVIEEVPSTTEDNTQSAPEGRRSVGVGTRSRTPLHKDVSSEFYRYKTRGIDKGEWKLLNIDTALIGGPKLVYDHQLELDSEAQVIYVHGGRVIDGAGLLNKYSGMYSYDIRSGKWSSIPIAQLSNDAIPPRFGHSMVYDTIKRKLMIFAGQQESNRYLCDMWEYDLQRQTLNETMPNFTAVGGPEPCFAQRAVIDSELQEVYIFDGLTRNRNAERPTAESAVWMYQYTNRPGSWAKVLPPPTISHSRAYKSRSRGTGSSTKRTRSEMDAEDEDNLENEIPVPRWAHQVVYDSKSKTFYVHGGNAGVSPATLSSRTGRRAGNTELEDRLDDFWSMKLERPPVNEVVRRAKFAIRQQQFREMCDEHVPVKTLTFLQTEVSAVVDHSNDVEEEAFRSLLSHLLQLPSLPTVDPEHSKFHPISSRSAIASPASTPSEHDIGWTNELPADEDTAMTEAHAPDPVNVGFIGAMAGEAISLVDDPYELRIREGRSLSSARFQQRTEVFESLLSFISPEAKQPDGSLLDMLHRVVV